MDSADAPVADNETDNELNVDEAVIPCSVDVVGDDTLCEALDSTSNTNAGSEEAATTATTTAPLSNPLTLESSITVNTLSNHPALNGDIPSLLDAKLAIAAANAEAEAISAAVAAPNSGLLQINSPNLSATESLIEAKAAIAAANASTAQSSDSDLIGKSKEEEQQRPEDDNDTNNTIQPSLALPSSSAFPVRDTLRELHPSLEQQQLPTIDEEHVDEYASLPTLATARVVSAFTMGSSSVNGSSSNPASDSAAASQSAALAREGERARFRQQVRDSLAAQAVQAEPLQRPESTDSVQDDANDNDEVFRRKRQIRLRLFGAMGILLLVLIVSVATVLLTRNDSRRGATPPTFYSNPTNASAQSTNVPSASATTIPVVYLPDGRQAFTETSQLYEAVDNYDEAIKVNETAQGSLVAIQYGYPMGIWDVSRLTDFSRVFVVDRDQAFTPHDPLSPLRTLIIPDLSGWNVSQATTMKGMFAAAISFTGEGIADWQVGRVTDFSYCFSQATSFSGDVSKWNTTSATSMEAMFYENINFNGDVSLWDVSNVRQMRLMFFGTQKFQGGDMTRWNVGQVRDMEQMFEAAIVFNGNISTWNTSNVVSLKETFQAAYNFNGDLSNWNVEKVTSMESLFAATAFVGGDLSRWNTSQVVSMFGIFYRCDVFNGNISTWDVSKVQDFELGFERCFAFNADISQWNTASAKNTRQMFKDAWAFTGDLSSWNTSSFTDMFEMFHNAKSFNGNLTNWDVSNVQDASRMFTEVKVYNQSLCSWREKLPITADLTEMFNSTECANTSDPSLTTTAASGSTTSLWSGPFCSDCDYNDSI